MPLFKHAAVAAIALACAAGAAHAHATLEQTQATIGKTTKVTLRVPHGCKGEATNEVRIEIPEGLYAVKPMPKAGWELATETGAYETPYDNHGTEMTEGVRAVVWSGGKLEDGWYDEFTVCGTVGPDVDAGTTLFFPSVQTCANGTADWTDTTGSHDVPNPAPKLELIAGSDDGHDGHGGHGTDAAVTVGDLELAAPFVRATLPNQPVAGGFVTITDTGTAGDVLTGARTPVAGEVQVHEMEMVDGVMKMRQLPDGLPIPAHGSVSLEPGGYHLMLMDLQQPLVASESIEMTLDFETAGSVTLTFPVMDAKGGHDAHGSH
ncbi:DUF1775 domain-containing protein [Chachezhania antarctica]|uniref:DUF1775 domain-containing protein n=1 Tax=Chachezhania antarctica TaxID=2340860 RepID=UPI000EAE15B3|nr:DUF1775 domain-containing protein [Chachezhania antarctica]